MAYNPSSFNYTPMTPEQFQPSQQFLDFSKWLAQQGMDMFNLARADRNTQLAVANRFQQEQADRQNALQQAQLGMAQRQQDIELPLAQAAGNQALFSNAQRDVDAAFASPWAQDYFAKKAWQEQQNALENRAMAMNTGYGAGGPGFSPTPYGVGHLLPSIAPKLVAKK